MAFAQTMMTALQAGTTAGLTSQLATASLLGSIGSAATSTVGSYYQARGQKTALGYEAPAAELQAKAAEQNALNTFSIGEREASEILRQGGVVKSAQRVAYAANGIDVNAEGTPQRVAAGTELMRRVDAENLRLNAVRSAFGARTEAAGQRGQAAVSRATADAISPTGSAFTTLVGEAGRVGSQWYYGVKTGAVPKNPTDWFRG
jgi:hypothetical protein